MEHGFFERQHLYGKKDKNTKCNRQIQQRMSGSWSWHLPKRRKSIQSAWKTMQGKGYSEIIIITDNWPEFRSKQFSKWLNHNKINWQPIEPGKPYQNDHIESFNGKFSKGCLNIHWFKNLKEARKLIKEWRKTYN